MNEIIDVIKELSNQAKIESLLLLANNHMTCKEIFEIFETRNVLQSYQATYKILESLTESNLLEKFYDSNSKRLKYKSRIKKIIINFENNNIEYEKYRKQDKKESE